MIHVERAFQVVEPQSILSRGSWRMIDCPCNIVASLVGNILFSRNPLLTTLRMGSQMLVKIKAIAP